MRMLPPAFRASRHGLDKRLDKKMLAPGDRFVHRQALGTMIDAMQENAFPVGQAPREEAIGAQSAQNRQGGAGIALAKSAFLHLLGKIEQPAGGDRSRGAVPGLFAVGWNIEVPARHEAGPACCR